VTSHVVRGVHSRRSRGAATHDPGRVIRQRTPARTGGYVSHTRRPLTVATYLVTGAAGFIGSHLSERLLANGHHVVGVDRFSEYYGRDHKEANIASCRLHHRFELHEADLVDVDVDQLLRDVDGVFHLAAQPGVRPSWGEGFVHYVRDNIVATQRLFEALARNPVRSVVASSSSVYGDVEALPVSEDAAALHPVSPYGLTKLTIEHLARIYVQQHRIHTVLLRYFTVYGPRQRPDMAFTRFVRAALTGEPLHVLGDGSQSRDFSYVHDVVDATIRALDAPAGHTYNIGGGEPTSLNAVIDALEHLLGRPVKVQRGEVSAGDVRHTWADTTRARRELGWTPSTPLRDGLAAQLAWACGNEAAPEIDLADRPKAMITTARRDQPAAPVERRPRVLTYSHDGFGLGHLRRTLRLIDALTDEVPETAALMVTGSHASHYFRFADNVDYLKLPSLAKVANGRYVSRRLGLDGQSIVGLRSVLAASAAEEFEPDLVVVDHYPLGVGRELEAALTRIRRELPKTRVVLGWRDILDRPEHVHENWVTTGQIDAVEHLYDRVLIYGCQDLYDPIAEYGLPRAVAERAVFTGYLVDQSERSPEGYEDQSVVCLLGGGEDGRATGFAFLEAMNHLVANGWSGTLVTGPLMPSEPCRALHDAASRIGVRSVTFAEDVPALLREAGVVVAMGGYNTVCEVFAAHAPAVIIPRISPREEQLLRARRMAARGIVRVMHPSEASGARLADLIKEQFELGRAEIRSRLATRLDTGGLATAARALAQGIRPKAAMPA
jgi:UDP-glucuronate 4-epimerase